MEHLAEVIIFAAWLQSMTMIGLSETHPLLDNRSKLQVMCSVVCCVSLALLWLL